MSDATLVLECPQLTLKTNSGEISLPEDFKGKWNIVYFYPKDDTPGCTKQACAYRDQLDDFKKLNVSIWGVSADDETSHKEFVDKFSLTFPLIVDSEKKLASGLSVEGRDTFLFNPDAKVAHVWRKVDPTETVGQTLGVIVELVK